MIVATPAGSLSLVIIGACADSLGFQVGEHYGFSVKSIDELLEGRRGRKTDNVKVKVILKWITGEQAPGGIMWTTFLRRAYKTALLSRDPNR